MTYNDQQDMDFTRSRYQELMTYFEETAQGKTGASIPLQNTARFFLAEIRSLEEDAQTIRETPEDKRRSLETAFRNTVIEMTEAARKSKYSAYKKESDTSIGKQNTAIHPSLVCTLASCVMFIPSCTLLALGAPKILFGTSAGASLIAGTLSMFHYHISKKQAASLARLKTTNNDVTGLFDQACDKIDLLKCFKILHAAIIDNPSNKAAPSLPTKSPLPSTTSRAIIPNKAFAPRPERPRL